MLKTRFYGCSVIGPAHVRENLPNQDAFLMRAWEGQWVAIVCDGMGSRPQSDIGSRQATKAILNCVKKMDYEADDRQLVQAIYNRWLGALKRKGITPGDAVTTCLLVWGRQDGSFRFAHLGDGMIASPCTVLSSGSGLGFSNETTGLGISERFSDWSVGVGQMKDHQFCLALMSDGVSEDLADAQGFCGELQSQLHKRSPRIGKAWLQSQLKNWPTSGHSDDKTLAVVRVD